jgi:hypothetical protein
MVNGKKEIYKKVKRNGAPRRSDESLWNREKLKGFHNKLKI